MGRKKPLVRVQTIFSAIKADPQAYKDFWFPIVDRINFIADEIRADKDKKFNMDPGFVCPSPWQRMVIAHEGSVAQCYTDYHLKNIMGNANEKSLYEIWHDKPFKELRRLQKAKNRLVLPTCKECCSGGVMKRKTMNLCIRTRKTPPVIKKQGVRCGRQARATGARQSRVPSGAHVILRRILQRRNQTKAPAP